MKSERFESLINKCCLHYYKKRANEISDDNLSFVRRSANELLRNKASKEAMKKRLLSNDYHYEEEVDDIDVNPNLYSMNVCAVCVASSIEHGRGADDDGGFLRHQHVEWRDDDEYGRYWRSGADQPNRQSDEHEHNECDSTIHIRWNDVHSAYGHDPTDQSQHHHRTAFRGAAG